VFRKIVLSPNLEVVVQCHLTVKYALLEIKTHLISKKYEWLAVLLTSHIFLETKCLLIAMELLWRGCE
jgi:hypothetical protein